MIDISVVVPTYNRMELLPRTLPALAAQVVDGFDYEVLFMDDGSDDKTGEFIEEAAKENPRFRYIRVKHYGTPAGPRNTGIREAQGKVVMLLDDDIIPEPGMVKAHFHFHQQHPEENYAALGELYLPPDVVTDPVSLFHAFPYDEVRKQKKLGYLFFWTGNVSFKRSFMLEHGMFDEDSVLHPVEDMECGYRLCAAGMELLFLPEARGQHVHKLEPSWIVKRGLRTGRANFALTQKVHDVGIKKRFGILDGDLPLPLYVWRAIRRTAFRVVDNPLTLFIMRTMGAEKPPRRRLTDAYYYLIYRRNMVAGYWQARREFVAQMGNSKLQEQVQ